MTDREIRALRDRYPGTRILIHAGRNWLAFGDDAKVVALTNVSGVSLDSTSGEHVATVPPLALEQVLKRMVAAGYRVALAEAT